MNIRPGEEIHNTPAVPPAVTGNREFRWILDTGGSGRGAWSGGFACELARQALRGGFYPAVLLGSSIGAFNALDLATGDPEILLRSWSHWARPVPVQVHISRDELGPFWCRNFRKLVKESVAFTLDPRVEEKLFQTARNIQLYIVASAVVTPGPEPASRRQVRRMFYQTATRGLPLKYVPARLHYRPVVFRKGPGEAPAGALELLPANVRQALMASCLIPYIMGHPVSLAGRQLVDGGFTLKIPLSFRGADRGDELDRASRAGKTLVLLNNAGGRMWKNSFRYNAWEEEEWVQRDLAEGRLLAVYPSRPLHASTITRNPVEVMKIFARGQEEAAVFLRQDRARRFFSL